MITTKKDEFKSRVHHWAGKLEVEVKWLGVRDMRHKWASCSTNGNLNFNSELSKLEEELWRKLPRQVDSSKPEFSSLSSSERGQ